MHKPLPILPAFLLLTVILFSCSKPAETSDTSGDSSAVAQLKADSIPPNENPENDTAFDGDPQGDFFFNDTSIAIINGDTTYNSDSDDGEGDEERMVSIHEPTIDVCGFSDDGKYFAFTQIVPGDPNGGEGSVFIIDVEKNKWAIKPGRVETPDDDVSALLKPVRTSLLSQYGIQYHKNVGKAYNFGKEDPVVNINGKKWQVVFNVDGLLIDLRMKGPAGQDISLQKDKVVPKTRGSVRRYRLHGAYVLGDKIAVFVEYDSDIMRDYENYQYYDRKNIAVTGLVK
jgi:hypothetical protein